MDAPIIALAFNYPTFDRIVASAEATDDCVLQGTPDSFQPVPHDYQACEAQTILGVKEDRGFLARPGCSCYDFDLFYLLL